MTLGSAASLFDDHGRAIVLGRLLGEGGEGRVFATRSSAHAGVVAKVWHAGVTRDVDGLVVLAEQLQMGWPTASGSRRAVGIRGVARDQTGTPRGVLIDPLASAMLELSEVLRADDRLHARFAASLRWQMRVAARIADIVARAHRAGIVLGDLGPRNFAVAPSTARVTAFDVDSWQVATRSLVARKITEDVQSPERVVLGPQHVPSFAADRWSLAVTLALVLLQGRHPFDGAADEPVDEPALVTANIAAGRSHIAEPRLRPTVDAPSAAYFAPRTRQLMEQALGAGHRDARMRPAAVIWVAALAADCEELRPCAHAAAAGIATHLAHPQAACMTCAMHAAAAPT